MLDRTSRVARTYRRFLVVAVVVPAVALATLSRPATAAAASTGTISTLAGGGEIGDGGPPMLSPLGPSAVATDASGDLFALDYTHHRIRKVSAGPDGIVGAVRSNGTLDDTDDVITTVAGDGFACPATTSGTACGDGGPALSAALGAAAAIAVDGAGNLYIADLSTVIRFVCLQASACTVAGTTVSPGNIETIAGTGQPGFVEGRALTAQFAGPSGLAVDHAGNLFIADKGNDRIRELCLQTTACATYAGSIAPGSVLTVAGGGSPASPGDGGPGTSAFVFLPIGIAVDSAENVYVATSTSFNDIRKLANVASNGTISTLASSSSCTASSAAPALCNPQQIALGASASSLYIANKTNNDVLRLDLNTLALTDAAGTPHAAGSSGDGGAATAAQLSQPYGVATSPSGQAFIADFASNNIREITATGIIDTVAGTSSTPLPWIGDEPGAQGQLSLSSPGPAGAVAYFNGDLYVADAGDNLVRKVAATGVISTVAGVGNANAFAGDGGPARAAPLNDPQSVALDRSGDLYIADTGNGLIRRVDAITGMITTVAGMVKTTYDANCVLTGESPVQGYNGDGVGTAIELEQPSSVAVDQVTGDVYIADTGNGLVRKLDPSGAVTTVAGNQALGQGFSGDGGSATQAQLDAPSGVAVDEAGNLYIADTGNGVIREVSTGGQISTVAGSFTVSPAFSGDKGPATAAGLNRPRGVAVDQGFNLYIADSANDAVRVVCSVSSGCQNGALSMTSGEIATLAGTGASAGFAGDGSAATSALLNLPTDVAVDASGNVDVTDAGNDRIRQIANPMSYTAPPNPRPIPSGPSPTPPAFVPSCPPPPPPPPGSSGSPGSSETGAAGLGSDAGTPVLFDQALTSFLPGLEHIGLARPLTPVTSTRRPVASAPTPTRNAGPLAVNNQRVPAAPLGAWWLALAIVGAALAGAAGATFWRWRSQPRIPVTQPMQDPGDTQEGPRLRPR